MGSYTMELREYIESWTQDQTGLTRNDVIETGRSHLFDFDYPYYDETKRKDFETNFINNFYMREIGFETEGLFKFRLETWLNINMPYWNKVLESELLQFDPLSNTKVDNTHNKTNDATSHVSGSTTSSVDETDTVDNFRRNLDSDTPDGRLAITTNDGQGVIEYATNIQEENENDTRTNSKTANDSGSSDSTNNVTEDFSEHREGKIGSQSYSEMLAEYRKVLLRVEKQIFDEMNELFMLVY